MIHYFASTDHNQSENILGTFERERRRIWKYHVHWLPVALKSNLNNTMIFCQTNTVTRLKNLNQNADEILGSVTSALRNRLRLLRQTKTSTEALYSSPRE